MHVGEPGHLGASHHRGSHGEMGHELAQVFLTAQTLVLFCFFLQPQGSKTSKQVLPMGLGQGG